MLSKRDRTIARLALKIAELEEKLKRVPSKRFKPPRLADVVGYCKERTDAINADPTRSPIDPELFIDHYTSNGWIVGKVKMSDWKAAVRTWEKSSFNHPPAAEAAVIAANAGIEQRRRERAKRQAQYAAEDAQAIRPRMRKA